MQLCASSTLLQLLVPLLLMPPSTDPAPASSTAAAAMTSSSRDSDVTRLQLLVRSEVDEEGQRVLTTRLVSRGSNAQQLTLNVTEDRRRHKTDDGNNGGGNEVMLDAVVAVVPEKVTEMVALSTASSVTNEPQTTPTTLTIPHPSPPLQFQSPSLEVEVVESPEELEPSQGMKRGPVPDGDFEEVKFSDYRPLGDTAVSAGLYKVVREAATWAVARTKCERDGAHLLVPETPAEAQAAAKAFLLAASPVGARREDLFFVGLSDSAREGHYVTVTGRNLTSLPFQRWHAREPSRGREQNGVALDVAGNLHDIPNAWRLAFMCETPTHAHGNTSVT